MKTIQYLFISFLAGGLCLAGWYYIAHLPPKDNHKQAAVAYTGQPDSHISLGQRLFKANCASCHKLEAKLIGPPLKGVEQRWIDGGDYNSISGRDWLKRFVRNWQDPVKAGHPYAQKIILYDPSAMTAFPQLTDDAIDSLLVYIESPQKSLPVPVVIVD